MALFTQNAQSSASGQKQRSRRRVEESSERTLVSPLMMKRPAGRVIWVFGRRKESAESETKPWEHVNPPLPAED